MTPRHDLRNGRSTTAASKRMRPESSTTLRGIARKLAFTDVHRMNLMMPLAAVRNDHDALIALDRAHLVHPVASWRNTNSAVRGCLTRRAVPG